MFRRIGPASLLAAFLCALQIPTHAQEIKVFGRSIQVHGFASQGVVYTDDNNWLTMNSSQGSAAFTDMGLNSSSQITDKFRAGAQVYDRNLGELGQYHPSLDWAFVDYRFKTWFGVRGGKVKTTLGLYNDTQDLDFLHTFALLPQSIYPADLRDATIAHLGGDIYGTIALHQGMGHVSYTAYAGHRSDSIYSGYPFLLSQFGTHFTSFGGLQYGGDLRWSTPLPGLLIGVSRLDQDTTGKGTSLNPANHTQMIPYAESSRADWMNQFYGQYTRGRLRLDSEYRRYLRDQSVFSGLAADEDDVRGWYFAGTYSVSNRFAFGSYYSRYTIENFVGGLFVTLGFSNNTDTGLPANHIYDKVITGRININRFWNVKVEGHFMNGYGDGTYPDGFYPQVNPQGFQPTTSALVVRTSIHF